MKKDTLTLKLFIIGVIALVCLIASVLVLGLVDERKNTHYQAKAEVGALWGAPQTVIGPMLVFKDNTTNDPTNVDTYVLPATLSIESTLLPEIRKRGIYETVVYTERLKVHGTFAQSDIPQALGTMPILSASISDTRSIEKQVMLDWNGAQIPFDPGANAALLSESGINTTVPLGGTGDYAFSFELSLNGSETARFAPVGKETEVSITGAWATPEFTGAFLPADREAEADGFSASWRVSSFGRNYPQTFRNDGSVDFELLRASTFGVTLNEGVDLYTQLFRSTKYAILFISITFIAFFLFEILSKVTLHPIQYLLVGAALALFYLLLLSLSEHIGFFKSYCISTAMTALLITAYSAKALGSWRRGGVIFVILSALYGYLYFTLSLEDYALLFGSLLLFVLLAFVMYLTRNIEWFAVARGEETSTHP